MYKLLFSIIIPCYNQAHFLSDCLNSLLRQEFDDWEAIVVNDGSPDNTNEVVSRFIDLDSRIHLLQKSNGGLSSARNYGLQFARGNRLIFLDADDFLYPDALLKISSKVKHCSDMDLIQCGYTYIKEDGLTSLDTPKVGSRQDLITSIFETNLGPPHSFCISRNLMSVIGNFDETLKSAEDWDLWIRAAKAGANHQAIIEPLVYYRYSRSSMSRNAFVMFEALRTVINRIPLKDDRISVKSSMNVMRPDYDVKKTLQTVLIRSIGISIMQDKIKESVDYFT
jgi:glycosyltransferase involved in cell wall biosynthesis